MPAPCAWALAVICLGALVSGCGTKTIDTGKVEQAARDGISKQVGSGVKSVHCPGDVEAKKGDTFRCTATVAEGLVAPITARQRDDSGHVKITWILLVEPRRVEAFARDAISSRQIGARIRSVDCPKKIELKEGSTFQCTANAADRSTAVLDLTETNNAGHVRIHIPVLAIGKSIRPAVSKRTRLHGTVTCHPELVVPRKGERLTCKAEGKSGKTRTATVRLTDDRGGFAVR